LSSIDELSKAMIIFNKYKQIRRKRIPYAHIIFLHIQKTAGTAISEYIVKYLKNEKVMRWGDFLHISQEDLNKYLYISGHFGFDYIKDIIDRSYSFTFLRNPIERVLSYYTFCLQTPLNSYTDKYPQFRLIHEMSINEFVSSMNSHLSINIDNLQTWILACDYFNETRNNLKAMSGNEILEMAKENLKKFSYIGFKESFQTDFHNILTDLNLPTPENNNVINKSESPITVESLSPDTLERLKSRVSIDFELYEYAWKFLRKR
jgi:hypothetical protein